MIRTVQELRERRRARRWQRWTEADPIDDYARHFGFGAFAAVTLFVAVIALVVVGFVLAR